MRFWAAMLCAATITVATDGAEAGILSGLGKLAREAGEAGVKSGDDLAGLGAAARGALDDIKTPGAKAYALQPEADGSLKLLDEGGGETRLATESDVDALFKSAEDPDAIEVFADEATLSRGDPATAALAERGALKFRRKGENLSVERGPDGSIAVRLSDTLSARAGPLLGETLYALDKPLNRGNLRPLRVDRSAPAGAPPTAPSPKDGLNQIDAIAPDAIDEGFARLRGQTVILQGEIRDGVLRTTGGDLPVERLRAAAAKADVHLVTLDAGGPRQPTALDTRLTEALAADTYGDLLSKLTRADRPLQVAAERGAQGRVRLTVAPQARIDATGSALGEAALAGGELLGDLILDAAEIATRDMETEEELDRRIVPGIPSALQGLAILNLILGLAASRTAWSAWRRIWPAPQRYRWAIYPVRFLGWLLVFLPLTGVLCFLVSIVLMTWRALVWIAGLFGSRRAA